MVRDVVALLGVHDVLSLITYLLLVGAETRLGRKKGLVRIAILQGGAVETATQKANLGTF